jgi:uncharacterized membrane protein YoaK (UPF0700 family)
MFRHKGKARTFRHNFRLAVFLSLVAGIVNICGVLALGVLTTNVTGHFAYFAEGMLLEQLPRAIAFLYYIFAFLLGAFTSGFLTEYFAAKGRAAPHNASLCVEILILAGLGLLWDRLRIWGVSDHWLASAMLFAMGLQNSLVTKVSDAVVRTTHLTGLFTDLGIELSQLIFYREEKERRQLVRSIGLRGGIIVFFFSGCIAGGYLYSIVGTGLLAMAAAVLVVTLIYDNLLFGYYRLRRGMRG